MSKVLITGGAGFIGSHVAKELINDKNNVFILDDMSRGFSENIPKGAVLVKGSITDLKFVMELFEKENFDYVIHTAAQSAVGLSHYARSFTYATNVVGSANLVNASIATKIKCFVFVSSISVYGANKTPFTEDMTPAPLEPYGLSKYTTEIDLKTAREMFGLNYVILRPYNVYGEGQHIGDENRNVIGIFMRQILQNKPMSIVGDGEQLLAFTHINDIAPIFAKVAFMPEAQNQAFNIGAEKIFKLKEAALMVAKAMGVEPNIVSLPKRKEAAVAHSSINKARKILGYEPSVKFAYGLEKMAAWAKREGVKRIDRFENLEIKRN